MDINNYKFYVRDVGISDTDLQNVLNDVISDIATNTKIFKRVFSFTLEPGLDEYPIKDLYQLADKSEPTILDINYTTNLDTQEGLIDYLTNVDINVQQTVDTTTDNTYSDYIEIIDLFDDKFNSYMKYLEPVSKDDYYLNIKIDKPIPLTGIAIINPLLSEISDRIEKQIRFAIISGLKAYTHTLENQPNEQVSLVLNKQFEYDKQKLINKYPYYGLSKKGVRNDNFRCL